MSVKTNVAKKNTPAEQGLEDLIETGSDDEGSAAPAAATVSITADEADEELESAGGGARVELFYSHEAYQGMKDNQAVITEGDVFDGTYEGSFTSGKFKSRTHKISLKTNGGKVIGLPPCGRLNRAFQYVPTGTRTLVRFQGSDKIKTGPWKGQNAYNYDVALPKSINAAIKAGSLSANYDLPKQS